MKDSLPAILHAVSITKNFPGVKALDDFSITISGGSVHALIGENGAGKSTLIKIFGGIHQPDSGDIFINGTIANINNPNQATAQGITLIHQELNLIPDMSVAENLFFGREPQKYGIIKGKTINAEASSLLERLKLPISPQTRVRNLSVANQQMIEIARALNADSQLLIMDEPTAALTTTETATLHRFIREFINPETAVLYISHRLEEVAEIADTITVMRDGRQVQTAPIAEMPTEKMIQLMVGRNVTSERRILENKYAKQSETPLIQVEGLSTKSGIKDIEFKIWPGEIVSFAGLMGAGRTEMAKALIGADPITSGNIKKNGKKIRIKSPADAVYHGIGYLSENRKESGLLLAKNCIENIALSSYSHFSNRFGWINDQRIRLMAEKYVDKLRIKTPSIAQPVAYLSGGNQQKVALAKWLAKDCDLLIIDEPTRGIDVGAKAEIYLILNELANQGKAILVISSELNEVLTLGQRIYVMCDGRIAGEIPGSKATEKKVMELATSFKNKAKIRHSKTTEKKEEKPNGN